MPLLGMILTAFLFALPAHAATRIIYFNATGTNRTTVGLSVDANSTCAITISNPSGYAEVIAVTAKVDSLDGWVDSNYSTPSADLSGTNTPTITAATTGSCAAASSCNLNSGGGSATFTWKFSTFPHKPTTSTTAAYKQMLRCSGSIKVQDVTTPGFLVGTGVLTTFVESAIMKTEGATGGSGPIATFGGIPVYTQVPIAINRSKPF
ncbi:MAG: hypothetical protein ACXWSD_00875 [Bdellovibrionota bacterium]